MPGAEMGEQIVLLVEVKRTDKAFKCPPANKPAHDSAWKYFYQLTSPCGKFACVRAAEFSVKMFQGTLDTDFPQAGRHACLLCAPHIATSCQKPHGIPHMESTYKVFVYMRSTYIQIAGNLSKWT